MMIKNRHERIIAAAPERIAALIWDFDRIWPTQIAPASPCGMETACTMRG